jgi:hypothetical protein
VEALQGIYLGKAFSFFIVTSQRHVKIHLEIQLVSTTMIYRCSNPADIMIDLGGHHEVP